MGITARLFLHEWRERAEKRSWEKNARSG